MRTAVVLFTRDLRVHDNPALHAACRSAQRVVPLFVVDPAIRTSPHRRQFLHECLQDLRASLRQRGGDLVIREGDTVTEAVRTARDTGAYDIAVAADASAFAARREHRLAQACADNRLALKVFDSLTIVAPGRLRPGGGDHYKVFTPYWRAWSGVERRAELPAPASVRIPDGLSPGALAAAKRSTDLMSGGETEGRRRLTGWARSSAAYAEFRDDLAGDHTSRLSPYLHFGCLSPVTVASRASADAFVRQLCWRDFFHQVLAAFPELPRRTYRSGAVEAWRAAPEALAAWQHGCTGVPIVDAGMRQLRAEGWMPNRARLITASYLTKHLGLDWRDGQSWFADLLLDADVANNAGNWQWVAGVGNDARPYRRFNPVRQAQRFDATGDYVRRFVPELAGVPEPTVHQPWLLAARHRIALRYPTPLARP
jgi:deoxyribodipyrimidine photo-lyase